MKVIDVAEILEHWHAGRKMVELSTSLGVDPKTVRKYVAPARAAGLEPGGPPLSREQWAALAAGWFPETLDRSSWQSTWPDIEGHRDQIKAWLDDHVTVATIHQRLRDNLGLSASESSLRRWLNANLAEEVARNSVVVLRETPPAGQEVQVDYGLLGRWFDPATERWRRVWGFIMVLAFSRLMFVRPVLKMDQRSWVEAHVLAFDFFGGVPLRIVPDNLKTGVIKPDLYDPLINRAFAEMASHYGTLIDPARALKPRDKARVERPVPYARDSFFAGRSAEFTSEVHMQVDALRWCNDVANVRHSRPLDGVAPIDLFRAEEAQALLALPRSAFELACWSKVKVHPDIHVKVGKTLYSIPWRHIGKELDAKEGGRTVEFFLNGVLVKTHVRLEKGKQTDYSDYPPEKIAFLQRNPTWCRRRAAEIGPDALELVEALMEVNALYRLRSAQGVVRLADKYSALRTNAACRRALAVGDPSYRTVKGILVAGTEEEGAELVVVPVAPAHLHGAEGLLAHLDTGEAVG
ncbi:MAG TPA: IS21 family transposase [Acidimicrobiales bacterium]|nr:IS21 family transposase [Acidimicrobiales bacterium]